MATHEAWWAAACKAHGDAEGTRALIEVLLLHRHMRHVDVVAWIAATLSAGALRADAVALEARKIADATPAAVAVELDSAQAPRGYLAVPRVGVYDQLLHRRTPEGGPGYAPRPPNLLNRGPGPRRAPPPELTPILRRGNGAGRARR